MIIDTLARAGLYHGISARLDQALAYLQQTDFSTLAPGRYDLDGDNLYAMVQQYTTKTPEEWSRFEAHREYIDVQYLHAGLEQLGYADIEGLTVVQEYDAKIDALLLEGEGAFLPARPGTFLVFFPTDAHLPCRALGAPQPVTKVVVKVKVG